MDNLEYLNQIAQSNRTTKSPHIGGLELSWSLIVKCLLAFVVVVSILVGLVALSANGSAKTSNLTKQLYTRATYLNSTLTDYNSRLKSSQLRAIGISLAGTLTNASSQIAAYITSTDSSKNALALNATTSTAEADNINNLNLALDKARLNGLLDRTYATQIQYQVSMLLTMISELAIRADGNVTLLSILQTFGSSLAVIEQSFENYSNPGD